MNNVCKECRIVAGTEKVLVNSSFNSKWPFSLAILTNSIFLNLVRKGKTPFLVVFFFFFYSTMQDGKNQVKALKKTLGLVVTN